MGSGLSSHPSGEASHANVASTATAGLDGDTVVLNESVQKFIDAEYQRLRNNKRDYLVVSEILRFKSLRDIPIDFSHLGTLFTIDRNKDGRFALGELHKFAEFYCAKRHQSDMLNDQSRIQGMCTLQMWKWISLESASRNNTYEFSTPRASAPQKEQEQELQTASMHKTGEGIASMEAHEADSLAHGVKGRNVANDNDDQTSGGSVEAFAAWFAQLFIESDAEIKHVDFHATGMEEIFVSVDSIHLIYRILRIHDVYGLNFQHFLDLLQRVAEEEGKMDLSDEEYDEYVPVSVLHYFMINFVQGFRGMADVVTSTGEQQRNSTVM